MYTVAFLRDLSTYLHELKYVLRPERSEQKELFLSLSILSASMIKKNIFFSLFEAQITIPEGIHEAAEEVKITSTFEYYESRNIRKVYWS